MAIANDPIGASRILVYGVTGSGKSTLAVKISTATGLPYHPVDDLTWQPDWIQVPLDEQRRRMTRICERTRIRRWEADPKGPAVLRLTKPAQADRLLDQLCPSQPQK